MTASENVFTDYDFCGWRISILKKKYRFLRKHGHAWPLLQIWRQKPVGTFHCVLSLGKPAQQSGGGFDMTHLTDQEKEIWKDWKGDDGPANKDIRQLLETVSSLRAEVESFEECCDVMWPEWREAPLGKTINRIRDERSSK